MFKKPLGRGEADVITNPVGGGGVDTDETSLQPYKVRPVTTIRTAAKQRAVMLRLFIVSSR
jgi:hypothetical protein